MTPLTLSGRALEIAGPALGERVIVRLKAPTSEATAPQGGEAALVRTRAEASVMAGAGFPTAVVVGDEAIGVGDFAAVIRLSDAFGYLADGDILGVHPDSHRVRTLYRRASRHNAFLVTERCNHYCLMCSQPPKDADDGWILDEIAAALPLVDHDTRTIGFTGGEPLLDWKRFIPLLSQTRDQLPDTAVHVLTNGRGFATIEIADAWASIAHPQLSAGIPIYAAVDHIHDYVVQARGAFDETVLGVLRLKDRGQRVEIRVVLHAITAPRLVETCRWIARNLPFVDHVALMGLENSGFAIANQQRLWIDPIDYQTDLARGVESLAAAGVPVSIYNLPYCVLTAEMWPFAIQSISDWKNAYLPQCDLCAAKPQCAGFFSTGRPKFSRAIEPLGAFTMA